MAKWWRAPENERDLLDRLYSLTEGFFPEIDPAFASDSSYTPWGGYEEAEEKSKDPNYLQKYQTSMSWRIGKYGLLPVPGIQLATAPWKLKFNFSAMAGVAWAYGYRKGVGPKDLDEAKHDLLAITVVWAKRRQPLSWANVMGSPMQDTENIEAFGKRFLFMLAQNGSLKIGRRTLGPVVGTLSAVAFSEEILLAIGKELFQLFKGDLFSGGVDEFVPVVASATTERLILDIQRRVTKELLPESESGYYRQSPVVVNYPRSGGVVYMPPDINEVAQLMQELLTFVHDNRGNIDPLLLAGIFHKQFVLIHPFTDGNGRTTRLATKVLLADMSLDTFSLFSFENFYNQNVTKYFSKVGEFGDWYEKQQDGIDFTTWLEYFTDGIIDELLRVKDHLPNAATPKTTLQPHDNAILDIIDKNGYATDSDYAERTDRSKASRTLDFNKLIELGLIERAGGGRSTHYVRKQ